MPDLSIMYSGGLDSLIAYHYAKANSFDPICIYVDFGHEYAIKEKNTFEKKTEWHPSVNILEVFGLWNLLKVRLKNQIIPSRNVLLSVIGSMITPRVWINALDGEQNGKEHDKSERFFNDTSELLSFTNEFFQPQTIVETPFGNMSKGEVIGWALQYGIPKEVLFETTSCYSDTKQKCGKCLTCVKRYIAFLENEIEEPGYDSNPLESDYFKELLEEIPKAVYNEDYSRFTKKRAKKFIEMFC